MLLVFEADLDTIKHHFNHTLISNHVGKDFPVVLQNKVLQIVNESSSMLGVFFSNLFSELRGREINLDLDLILLIVRVNKLSLTNENLITLFMIHI